MTPVRFSHLRAYGRSAAHGHHARMVDSDATRAMQRGTAVHALLFENRAVIGYPGPTRRGREYDAFVQRNPDAEILTMSEFDKARRMADAVRACKLAEPLLIGTREETLLFKWMGLYCRATPDVRGNDFLTELKTSASADPSKFLWHARRMHYHAQLRFQEYGCKEQIIHHHWIVCVESEPPHQVTVFHVEPEALDEGDKLLVLWAERLKNCEASDYFPPYVDCPVPLVWPKEMEYDFGEETV